MLLARVAATTRLAGCNSLAPPQTAAAAAHFATSLRSIAAICSLNFCSRLLAAFQLAPAPAHTGLKLARLLRRIPAASDSAWHCLPPRSSCSKANFACRALLVLRHPHIMAGGSAFGQLWLGNPWLCWGVGSIASSTAGFVVTSLLLELLLASGAADSRLIVYASSGDAPRKQLIAATQARIPFWKQVRAAQQQQGGRAGDAARTCRHGVSKQVRATRQCTACHRANAARAGARLRANPRRPARGAERRAHQPANDGGAAGRARLAARGRLGGRGAAAAGARGAGRHWAVLGCVARPPGRAGHITACMLRVPTAAGCCKPVHATALLHAGHRVQHESELLWRCHKVHHSIDTPTPASTLYIHPVDAALQGSVPLALAAAAVRPAPAVLYCFLAARIGENALNHSGIDSALLDVLTLKRLPLRAPAAFHDAHHKYCNHAWHARNYGVRASHSATQQAWQRAWAWPRACRWPALRHGQAAAAHYADTTKQNAAAACVFVCRRELLAVGLDVWDAQPAERARGGGCCWRWRRWRPRPRSDDGAQ